MRGVTSMFVALSAAPAAAWVSSAQSVYGAQISEIRDFMNGLSVNRDVRAQLGGLWTYPASSSDDAGLGGGITWAFNPALCDLLMARNDEATFFDLVTCDDFHGAVTRAFAMWEANSRHLKFVDVSKECTAMKKNFGPPQTGKQSSKYPHGGCPIAEIWVTNIAPSRRRRLQEVEGDGAEFLGRDGHGTLHTLDELVGKLGAYHEDEASGDGLDLMHMAKRAPRTTASSTFSKKISSTISSAFSNHFGRLFGARGLKGPQTSGVSTSALSSPGAPSGVGVAARLIPEGRDAAAEAPGRALNTLPDASQPLTADLDDVGEQASNTVVAYALSHRKYSTTMRFTNGEIAYKYNNGSKVGRTVVETYAGTFAFNVQSPVCWYLDSGWCYGIHQLKTSMGGAEYAEAIIHVIIFGIMGIGMVFFLILFCRVCRRATGIDDADEEEADEDGDGKISTQERIDHVMSELSGWNPMTLAIFFMFLICPPLIDQALFMPCFRCEDFQATATHEIGHFLGLGHPDNIPDNWVKDSYAGPKPGVNSYHEELAKAKRPTPDSTCFGMWEKVKAGVPAGADLDPKLLEQGIKVRNAQMEAYTQKDNPDPCLKEDDLEALNVLYPDCGEGVLISNVCPKQQQNIGRVRMMIYLLVPAILGLLSVMACSSCFHSWQRNKHLVLRRKKSELRMKNETLQRDAAALSSTLQAHEEEAKKAKSFYKRRVESAMGHKDAAETKAKKASITAAFQSAAARGVRKKSLEQQAGASTSAQSVEVEVHS